MSQMKNEISISDTQGFLGIKVTLGNEDVLLVLM